MKQIEELQQLFATVADEEKAVAMSAYMKNLFPFAGIQKPIRAKVQREWMKELVKEEGVRWDIVQALWRMEQREYHYVALEYLVKVKKRLLQEDMEQMTYLITEKSWWDSVDVLASHLVGHLCKEYPILIQSHILPWSEREDVWLRRTAILFQLKYKEETNTELLEKIILQNCETKEFFLNKAIGWILREYSKTNKEWVRVFIATHTLHSLSVREGRKYLG